MREMKDSGVEWIGEIPQIKNLQRNKYKLSFEKGKLPSSTNIEGKGKPYIGASDLDSVLDVYLTYTEDDTLPETDGTDLLVLWDGARAGLSGHNKMGKISSTIVKITGDSTIYKPFLYWYYKGFESYMYDMVNGTTIPHMNRKYIEDIGFIDWSIEEQKRLVDYLDTKCAKINSIIKKQQAIIEKLKEYKLSVITEAVTKGLNPDAEMKDSGIDSIGHIPASWNVDKFKRLSDEIGDGLHSTPSYYSDGDYYFVNGQNIGEENLVFNDKTDRLNEEEYMKYKQPLLTDNTIFITLNGATYGKTSFYNGEKVLLGKSAGYVTLKAGQNKRYVRYYLQSSTAKLIMELSLCGSTIANLSLSTLNGFRIPMPSKKEQEDIVGYLDEKCTYLDRKIKTSIAIIEKLQEYKKSLIYEVVTGKKEV